jgi:sugar/nucleoside kinase (ribokinase family)
MGYDILCVGEVNVDLILSGLDRVPGFGEEVLAEAINQHAGGCTANVATFAAQLGLNTALRARVGRDEFGDFLISELERAGVSTELIIRDDSLRTGITVSLSGRQDRAFVTYLGTIDSLTAADVPNEVLRQARHVHTGSYFLQRKLQPSVQGIFARAHALGLTTSLDTGYDPYETWDAGIRETLAEVDVFLPNEVEAAAIGQTPDTLASASELASHAGQVALKLGPEGSVLLSRDGEVAAPGFTVEVVETTCCGDAFNAGYLCAMLDGRPAAERLLWGNAAGALIAGGSGACIERLSRPAIESLIASAR